MRPAGIWMPLYVGDYLADTQHLTTEEHGAYILLLLTYWRRGEPLPDDDSFLARVTKSTSKGGHKWSRLRKGIAPFFDIIEGQSWVHKRLEKELLKSSGRSQAGVRANSERWSGRSPNHSHSHIQKESKKEYPSPSVTETEIPKSRKMTFEEGSKSDWPSGYFLEFWSVYPRKIGKASALKAMAKIYRAGGPSWEKIMDGVRAYAESAKSKDIQYVKHPATWLNSGCWDDELTPGEFTNGTGRELTPKEKYSEIMRNLGSNSSDEDAFSLLPKLDPGEH
jgi:uncharacterized protein YdaU (DUF1376 family)